MNTWFVKPRSYKIACGTAVEWNLREDASMRCAVGAFRFTCCLCTVTVCCAFGLATKAAQPSDTGEGADNSAPRYLSLNHLDAYIELRAEFTRTRVESPGKSSFGRQRSQTNRDRVFEEHAGLSFGGTILDPKFINFSGDFSFALTQERYKEDIDSFDRTDHDSGYLVQYDLRANFLQGRKVSGSVYGLRLDDRINRRFQPTLDERRTGFGTTWVYIDNKFPMEFTYDYLETDRTGNSRHGDDEHYTENNFHYGVDWSISQRSRVKASYEHAETKQEYQGAAKAFETTRDLLNIEHEYDLGTDSRDKLRTLLRWQEESGDFARDLFQIGPQLTLRHGDDLQTSYEYQFNRERYEGLDIETQRLDFQLVHRVYTNLVTTANVFGLYEDVEDDVQTTQYGASIDLQYNRKNRWGRLYANLALAYDTEEVNGDNGRRIVLDEAQAFRDPIAITLRNRNVATGTVSVTDTTNRRLFRLGIDYAIVRQGNATRLIRILSGQIADRDTVLIDYQYNTPADGKLDTVRMDLSLEQRFANGLTPYYRLSYRNQEDDDSTGFFRRGDRTNHHRLGARFEADRYSLGAEYEVFDDTIDPYDAYHLNGLVRLIRDPDHALNASTRFSQLFFEGGFDKRDVIMLDVELDHRWRLSESLSTIERVAYRLENDSGDGVTHGWDVTAGLEYVVGDLSGELTFVYDRLDLPASEEDDFGLFLRVRREFPNVLTVGK